MNNDDTYVHKRISIQNQEGNEVDKYNLNHPKLIYRPFMTITTLVVGKFYDNFHDLPSTKENHFSIYKDDDEDDPNILFDNSMPKV